MSIVIDNLLKDVSAENRHGVDLSGEADFYILEDMAKGKPETQFSEAEPPKWDKVLELALTLFNQSKDLWVAYYIITALVSLNEDKGLIQGLEFLNRLLSNFWDNLYPSLEKDEEEPALARLNIIKDLFSANSAFNTGVRNIKLSKSGVGVFSYRNIQIAKSEFKAGEKDKTESLDVILAAIADTNQEIIASLKDNFSKSLVIAKDIKVFLSDKNMSSDCEKAVSDFITLLDKIGKYLDDKPVVKEVLEKNDSVEQSVSETEAKDTVKTVVTTKGTISSNQDVIRLLDNICQWYEKNEPSNPVPLFLKRAKAVIGKNFVDIVGDVAISGLNEVMDLFKIEKPALPAQAASEQPMNNPQQPMPQHFNQPPPPRPMMPPPPPMHGGGMRPYPGGMPPPMPMGRGGYDDF